MNEECKKPLQSFEIKYNFFEFVVVYKEMIAANCNGDHIRIKAKKIDFQKWKKLYDELNND